MKTNPLSVKKLMKNLILRTLRQLYAVSEIIILIRWVRPPTKVEILQFEFFFLKKILGCSISSTLQCLHSFRRCSSLTIYILEFYVVNNIHLLLILQVAFSAKWMWSDPSPSMLNSTQSVHKFFMCVLFETRSKSSLCPCQLKNLRTKTLNYSNLNCWLLPPKPFHIPR